MALTCSVLKMSKILIRRYPNTELAPVETKKATTAKIKECFTPFLMLPSVSFPIANPAKNP